MSDPIVLHPHDNVVILTARANAGDDPLRIYTPLKQPIAMGHKIARTYISSGSSVLKFGQFIGIATMDIAAGDHVHTHNCRFADPEIEFSIGEDLALAQRAVPQVHPAVFHGYLRSDGQVGTRNYLALVATVNCSATVIRQAVLEIEECGVIENFENVDGIVAFAHNSGCGMSSEGRGIEILDRVLWGHATHPNVGGSIIVGLGCEVMQIARLNSRLGIIRTEALHSLTIQDTGGTMATIDAIKDRVIKVLPEMDRARRSTQPISVLKIALQCGGSDGFSSITANPALGFASDLIVGHGGTAILSETPEIYGAEQLLLRRASSNEVARKLMNQINWWKDYTSLNATSMDNNPSPGNKQGGVTTILEKALGAVAKSGATPLMAVYEYAERIEASGFVFMDTPGYDPVSVTGQIAGGAQLVVFTTGRGSAFGSKPAPTIKLATSDKLFAKMQDDMDMSCGDIVSARVPLEQKGQEIFELICATASGQPTKSESIGLGSNEYVPWQIGATL